MTESRTSQETPRIDPFEFWRNLYEANEKAWTKAVKDLTATKDYAEAQGKVLESMLALQKVMRDSMTMQLNSLNLPTRDDVARLGELILSLEEKVDQVVERLDNLDDQIDKRASSLDRLIDKRMAALDEQLGKRAAVVDQRLAHLAESASARGSGQKAAPERLSRGGQSRGATEAGKSEAAEKTQ